MKNFHKQGGGGATGFHISYSEIHMYQKYGQIMIVYDIKSILTNNKHSSPVLDSISCEIRKPDRVSYYSNAVYSQN